MFVTADRFGGAAVDARFEARLRRHLERFRMAGYDLEVDAPRFVPLDVELHICVKPDYFRSEVLRAVQRGAVQRRAARRPARRLPSRQLLLRPAGVSQPHRRGRAGGRRRRVRCAPEDSSAWSIPIRPRSTNGVIPIGRPGDRPARQQSQLPRARPARARGGRRQMSAPRLT